MKKKIMITVVLCLLIFVVGCLDYKAYDVPAEDDNEDTSDADLLKEIEAIEKELAQEEGTDNLDDVMDDIEENPDVEVTEEEIVLPELGEDLIQSEELFVKTVKENELVRLKTVITDPDNDPVTYSFTAPIDDKGEWKTNYGDAGEYIVTLTASDGKLTTSKKIKLIVERVNVPPVITGVRDITINEGEVINFEPTVSDPNNDAISIEISEPLKAGSFVSDHTSAGEYTIDVVANDGELESKQSFKLTINDINEKPVITNIGDVAVQEGDVVEIKPDISDLDGDEFTVTISDPVGNDGIWETSFTDHGDYTVTVSVYDGKDTVTKQLKIIVEDVNKAPEIIDISLSN
jgi:hypothetical protein